MGFWTDFTIGFLTMLFLVMIALWVFAIIDAGEDR